jgi:chondroitin AC lyase
MRKLAYCIGLLLLSATGYPQTRPDVDTILNRYKTFLFLTDTSLSNFRNIPPVNDKGMWDDINYKDNQPGQWQAADHLRRIRSLAMAWSKENSPVYHSGKVKKAISLALGHWNQYRYKKRNWWFNEIGIPQIMRDIIVLMKDSLSKEQLGQSLDVLEQYKLAGTGANLVWSADLGLHYGALTNNIPLMQQCRDTILTIIKITTQEGVQPDYSFHQHGRRLQMYHYGGAFLLDDVRLAWQLRGSWLAFPPVKIQVLTDFVLNGWQWMARGINTVPGTIDRAASRLHALHSADIRKIIPLLYQLQPDSSHAFKNMLAVQDGKTSLKGYRYFPFSDFTAFQQPHFSFFLKTNSTRTLLTESINEENLKGDLLNSGDSYFISNGNEYYDLMPFWDWKKLPGITNFSGDSKNKIQQQNFVGNVSDSSSGLAVMDYSLKKNDQSLKAKKFWASYKNITVALIAGIKTANLRQPPFTVLDQCRWQSNVTLNRAGNILPEGIHKFDHIDWVYQNNFVYIPLSKDSIEIQIQNRTGRWSDINKSESTEIVTDKVFMPLLIHSQDNKASGYVVAYASTPEQAESIAKNPSWKILRNDSVCQAVSFDRKTVMAAFYEAGKSKLSSNLSISVDKPCLILITESAVYISDPGHTGGLFSLKINKSNFFVCLPSDGTTLKIR